MKNIEQSHIAKLLFLQPSKTFAVEQIKKNILQPLQKTITDISIMRCTGQTTRIIINVLKDIMQGYSPIILSHNIYMSKFIGGKLTNYGNNIGMDLLLVYERGVCVVYKRVGSTRDKVVAARIMAASKCSSHVKVINLKRIYIDNALFDVNYFNRKQMISWWLKDHLKAIVPNIDESFRFKCGDLIKWGDYPGIICNINNTRNIWDGSITIFADKKMITIPLNNFDILEKYCTNFN
jgi:hypothetical protein